MMKVFAYVQAVENELYNVFVTNKVHSNERWLTAVAPKTKNLFEGFRLALDKFEAGQREFVNLDSIHVTQLGEVVDDDVAIGQHRMFLVTADELYWLANKNGQLATLSDLESTLQSYLGTATCVLSTVSDEHIAAVVTNYSPIEHLRPQVLVLMNDGNPVGVQLFGLPPSTVISVLDVIHPDSVHCYRDEYLGDLVYEHGDVKKNVRNVTPVVQRLNSFSQLAKLI
jgi:hypothetical protein